MENLAQVVDQVAVVGELRDPAAVRNARVVRHYVAIAAVQSPITVLVSTFEANVTGTPDLVVAGLVTNYERVVFTLSSSVYGDGPLSPKTESVMPRPLSPFAVSKLSCDEFWVDFTHVFSLPSVALRYLNGLRP